MRILLHKDPIIERARLTLICIQTKVNRTWMILWQKCPFQARRKACATATTQATLLDDFSKATWCFITENPLP